MNKYQESYQRLTNRIYKNDHIEEIYKDLEVLGELVDKATPKYAIKKYFRNTKCVDKYICPNCGRVYFNTMFEYCGICGQALSYEERNEQ